ncbi:MULTISPECIES: sigma factor G inhibitor Gin [Sediminibacillus]|uniref:sigma factor G inhibitor Gin n=1 Tax=Sediminibacillus TaxID=482460 RepID=UPI00040F3722|nr:sigma factor G inhibitor Gin [Sediminibacillus terrae]
MGNRGTYETCGVCGVEKQKGIHLYTLYICCECEQKIIHTEPSDAAYQYYLDKLKNMKQTKLYS